MTQSDRAAPRDDDWKPNVAVESTPVIGRDGSCRGWVRLHTDRERTDFAIVVDTTSFLDPYEARQFALALVQAADRWETKRAVVRDDPEAREAWQRNNGPVYQPITREHDA